MLSPVWDRKQLSNRSAGWRGGRGMASDPIVASLAAKRRVSRTDGVVGHRQLPGVVDREVSIASTASGR